MNQLDNQHTDSQRTGGHDPDQRTTDNRPDPQPRRNPRIVIGTLDFFEMIMEQDEQG